MTIVLRDLRARIAQIEGFSPERTARAYPTGWASVDVALPGGGLLAGALHEIHTPDPADGAAMGFAVRLIARIQREMPDQVVLWASCRADLFPPGLHAAGVDPARMLIARCQNADELLYVFEEGLRSKAIPFVFGEIGELDFALSRRLQLAAADTGATLVLLRPARFGSEPSAAVTRWRVEARPGGWALTLFRSRNGRTGSWPMPAETGECS